MQIYCGLNLLSFIGIINAHKIKNKYYCEKLRKLLFLETCKAEQAFKEQNKAKMQGSDPENGRKQPVFRPETG